MSATERHRRWRKKKSAEAKVQAREARLAEIALRLAANPLPADKRYGVILCDPPWEFEVFSRVTGLSRSPDRHYPTMTLADVKALPVADLAGPHCALLLWATRPRLADAIAVIGHWGFSYKTCIVWHKPRLCLGHWFRDCNELLLLAIRGKIPAPLPGTQLPSEIEGEGVEPRRHSSKPEAAYKIAEGYWAGVPKVELFARTKREGWDAWGNERFCHGEKITRDGKERRC
jgi:N6-adenosine-specific RNA methylase IME4